MQQAWKRSLDILKDRIDGDDYNNLIRRLHPVATRDRNVLVEAPNKLAVDLITKRYLNLIEDVLSQTAGIQIRVLLDPGCHATGTVPTSRPEPTGSDQCTQPAPVRAHS